MPLWLLTAALISAVVYVWGGTSVWLGHDCFHFGWDWAIYALLIAVPLIVIGVLATCRARSHWRLVNLYLTLFLVWSLTVVLADTFQWSDIVNCLTPWTQTYGEHGLLWSLRHIPEVSNYTAFYNYFLMLLGQCHPSTTAILYAIKYLTYLASIATAAAIALIVAHVRQKPFSFGLMAACLLLPPVLMESAIWGQCDAIYTAFCLFAFYAALKHRSKTSMVLVGLAFAIKFQFIFIVPVLFIMLIIKDADGKPYLRWRDLWLAPLMYVINLLPVLVGAEFLPLIAVYIGQTQGHYLTANAGTFPVFIDLLICLCQKESLTEISMTICNPDYYPDTAYTIIYYGCLAIGLIGFAVLLWVVLRRSLRQRPTARDLVYYALLFALSMPFIMPHMYDRFFFLAVVLAVVYAGVSPSTQNYWVAALIIASPTLAFLNMLGAIGADWMIWLVLAATLMNLSAWVMLLLPLNARAKTSPNDVVNGLSPSAAH